MSNALDAFVQGICPTLDNLAARWNDEKEYEDFADYRTAILNATRPHPKVVLQRITPKPFAVHFTIRGDYKKYTLVVGKRNISLKETI